MSEVQVMNNPNVDIVEILNIANKYLRNEMTAEEILTTYGSKYLELAKTYVSSFSTDFIESKINHVLSGFSDPTLKALNEEGFSKLLTGTTINVAGLMKQYFCKEIDAASLLSKLGETGVKDILDSLISAYDIDINFIRDAAVNISKESGLLISYAAFSEAYKYLMSALDDAALQHEHRLMIEKQCEESVAMIKEYREKLQESITEFFEKHLQTFERGFVQMDKAIAKNDSNGYLKGNSEIQKMLGYYAQFNTQEEFDELMDSDISFKL